MPGNLAKRGKLPKTTHCLFCGNEVAVYKQRVSGHMCGPRKCLGSGTRFAEMRKSTDLNHTCKPVVVPEKQKRTAKTKKAAR